MSSLKNYVGISLDHSGSMRHINSSAMEDFNRTLKSLQENSINHNQDTILSVVKCGVGHAARVERFVTLNNVDRVVPLAKYVADGAATPLYESIFDLIKQFESLPDANDTNVSFVVMAITDGYENCARDLRDTLRKKIEQLQRDDRWTFIFRVPVGLKHTVSELGAYDGNIQEWETTKQGMDTSSITTQSAVSGYYAARSAGEKSSKKFFADLSSVSQETIKSTLEDISSEVALWPISVSDAGSQIRPFVEKKLGRDMKKGAAFYQLNKPERIVQDYKKIIVRDKLTNAIYAGRQARDLLNLPHDGNISLSPGKISNYDVFIQSTSVNRKLEQGTQLLYWEDTGIAFKTVTASPVVKSPVVAPVPVRVPVILTPRPAVPVAPIKAPVKVAPKRIRNRNTPQEKIRVMVAGLLITGVRNVKNYSALYNFDSTKKLTLAIMLANEFSVRIPIKEIDSWTIVQDVLDSAIPRIAPSL